MKKIMIIGCCGSGKSTLARRLHEILQIPVIHLDQEYWKPNWVEPSKPEWESSVTKLVERDSWIMDGNYSGTWNIRMPKADTIIYLDKNALFCTYRILKRTFLHYGKVRPDMPEGCRERLDWEFIHYVLTYNLTRRKRNLQILEKVKNEKQILIFRKEKEMNSWVDGLS